jgi:hypothetical protein
MIKDDKYFERLRTGEPPQLPSSLATFVGQTLCNHYEDTVRSPLPDDMKQKLDELGTHVDDGRGDDDAPIDGH